MCLPCLPSFPHSVEFLANTIGFYIICKDYDSINQHSHPSTTTPPTPTGGGAGNHDHPRGGGVGLPRAVPYIYMYIYHMSLDIFRNIDWLLKPLPFRSSLLLRTSDSAVPIALGSLQGGEQMDTAKISVPEPL